jgi:hypothetical protein
MKLRLENLFDAITWKNWSPKISDF